MAYPYKGFTIPEYKDPRWDIPLDPFMRATIDHITAPVPCPSPGTRELFEITALNESTQKLLLGYVPNIGSIVIIHNGIELFNFNDSDYTVAGNEVTAVNGTYFTEHDVVLVEYRHVTREIFYVDSTIEILQQITTILPPIDDSIALFLNGIRLINYVNSDFTISGNNVMFTVNQHITEGDVISIRYDN